MQWYKSFTEDFRGNRTGCSWPDITWYWPQSSLCLHLDYCKIIANGILVNGHDGCFISVKKVKPNFTKNPKTRLMNPAKNEIGRLSKSIIDKTSNKLRNSISLNQWKDKSEVISWFNKIEEKRNHTFIVFDIQDFYHSISKYILTKAVEFAKTKVSI